jgi:hypothetical protein
MFQSTYDSLRNKEYFQQWLGYECVDDGKVPGEAGDVDVFIMKRLRKDNLWPIHEKLEAYTEDDLFDMLELLYDHVSRPLEGRHHSYNACGWHYDTFDKAGGQQEFRDEMNDFLADYTSGYQLSDQGEVQAMAEPGLQSLLDAPLPTTADHESVKLRVQHAIQKFSHHNPSIPDRRDAVRQLADVLEFLKPKMSAAISSKDEGDLSNIANNFGIRHHNCVFHACRWRFPLHAEWRFRSMPMGDSVPCRMAIPFHADGNRSGATPVRRPMSSSGMPRISPPFLGVCVRAECNVTIG